MLALFTRILILTAETTAGAASEGVWSKFVHLWNDYANFPGFEAWKFFNLAVFIAVMYYLLKQPLSNAFKAKREVVRAELIRAAEEKKAAEQRLAAAEKRLGTSGSVRENILANARSEAKAEKERISQQTEMTIAKMNEQTAFEIERRRKQVMMELRRFSAEETIRVAEENIRKSLDSAKDAELVRSGIKSIGGLV